MENTKLFNREFRVFGDRTQLQGDFILAENGKEEKSKIEPGLYRHYKGNLYLVVDEARHSETLERMTVYRALYGKRELWVRPSVMFSEKVTVEGRTIPRFIRIDQ